MLDRVIRRRQAASSNLIENWHFEDFRARKYEVWYVVYIYFSSDIFSAIFVFLRVSRIQYLLKSIRLEGRKAWTKIALRDAEKYDDLQLVTTTYVHIYVCIYI